MLEFFVIFLVWCFVKMKNKCSRLISARYKKRKKIAEKWQIKSNLYDVKKTYKIKIMPYFEINVCEIKWKRKLLSQYYWDRFLDMFCFIIKMYIQDLKYFLGIADTNEINSLKSPLTQLLISQKYFYNYTILLLT